METQRNCIAQNREADFLNEIWEYICISALMSNFRLENIGKNLCNSFIEYHYWLMVLNMQS